MDTERGFDQNVTYGKAFRGPRSIYQKALKENALLLSVMASADNASVADAYDFLAQRIHVHSASDYGEELDIATRTMRDNPAQERALQLLVQNADLGIRGIELDTGTPRDDFERLLKLPVSDLQPELVDAGKAEMTKLLARVGTQPASGLRGQKELANESTAKSTNPFFKTFDEFLRAYTLHRRPITPPQVLFVHEGKDGTVLFKKRDESDGTIAAIAFLSLALRDLSTQSLTIVDEMDSSLHPSMVRALVGLYQDPLTNPHDSQLVFTTHDVSLLMQAVNGDDPIAPDQFWIVEKRAGESELYPATDYGIAEDENMARNYLNGQYGGVLRPRLREAFAQALEMLEGVRNEDGGPDGEAE